MQSGIQRKKKINAHVPHTHTHAMNMHRRHLYAIGLLKQRGRDHRMKIQGTSVPQRDAKSFLERLCSADFTVDHLSKTVFI